MKKDSRHRCQYCGEVSPAREWIDDTCPKCKRKYNWVIAQDSEE